MLFNSIEFGLFLPTVFILYWFVFNRSLKVQNVFILCASYIFYGWWDWRFLILIAISSMVDYLVGIELGKNGDKPHRKRLLGISLFVNLGLLGVFKYFDFFIDTFVQSFSLFGYDLESPSLHLILPIGISFYTLQTLSYTIDVYRKNLKPTTDIVSFFAYVSFFPQLVAGPIERATSLLPQMQSVRVFDETQAKDGLRQILWGLFKKIVVADNCAVYAMTYFANYSSVDGSTAFLGMCLGVVQFYCDFSGYSDIAIGTSRLFGFNLKQNFAYPFFARDIAEFWRRWHISLISWIRDYPVKALGGFTRKKIVRNIFIVFILTGFWHGASWAFIFWGFVQFLFFIPYLYFRPKQKPSKVVAQGKLLPSFYEMYQMIRTFLLFSFSGLLFFSESIYATFDLIFTCFFSKSMFTIPEIPSYTIIFSVIILFTIEWLQREKLHGLEHIQYKVSKPIRWIFYYVLIFTILYFGGQQQQFIYFQF